MFEQELNEEWQELKEIWRNSSRTKKINLEMSGLINELKGKMSQFEKDAITRDIKQITSSISQFEKDSIAGDLKKIMASIHKILRMLGIKKEK
ncbi:hypothetical protein QQ008_15070 [Fulvivirgaceae bacterium BMA10]|uniref:Uncharacterized protein n=1 Tax=Splendidivirga corallicola TaxID=3051826 RepID=A0ABT8KR81_9BACT|nr:hypothetical protein [Fulvivirgaceae bacterium BMA10]